MAQCEVCRNNYDKSFEINMAGKSHIFDSFECAIKALAPVCSHCGCKIIGHGMEAQGIYYCCAHWAHQDGKREMHDRTR